MQASCRQLSSQYQPLLLYHSACRFTNSAAYLHKRFFSSDQHVGCPANQSGILVLNAGSSSLKFSVFDREQDGTSPIFSGSATGLTVTKDVSPTVEIKSGNRTLLSEPLVSGTHEAALSSIAQFIQSNFGGSVAAVGHRIVHGGTLFPSSCVLGPENLEKLSSLNSLAPLHNPHNLGGIRAAAYTFPRAVQVGVFDTSYHSTLPRHAYTYPLPRHLAAKYRKFGFHGTSHKFVVEQARKYLKKDKINAISFHLGNGCSVACIKNNVSIDTTMGYTPLAGLPMGSRSGDIDPSIIISLAQEEGLQIDEINDILLNKSGLYGVCGSSDSASVERGFVDGDPDCTLAFNIFSSNVKKCLGAYAAVLNGDVDCIIFTGGIGENSSVLHREVCEGLIPVCHDKFSRLRDVCDVTKRFSDVSKDFGAAMGNGFFKGSSRVLVIKTNEELAIARECFQFLNF